MGRLVEPVFRHAALAGGEAEETLAARVAKYVPVEVAGMFPIIDNALAEFTKGSQVIAGVPNRTFMWLVFIILFVLNILYLRRQAQRQFRSTDIRRRIFTIHTLFSCVAFLLWTYIIKGSIWQPWQNPYVAIVLVGLFVLAAGLIEPVAPSPEDDRLPDAAKP